MTVRGFGVALYVTMDGVYYMYTAMYMACGKCKALLVKVRTLRYISRRALRPQLMAE